jgi:hypothetical protein
MLRQFFLSQVAMAGAVGGNGREAKARVGEGLACGDRPLVRFLAGAQTTFSRGEKVSSEIAAAD